MSEGLDGGAIPERPDEPAAWWAGASWPIALAAISFGVGADLLLRGPAGAGIALLALAAAVAVAALRHPRPAAWAFLVAAPIFMSFAIVRTSPQLLALDLVACTGLLVLGASFARVGDPLATVFGGYLRRGFGLLRAVPAGVVAPVAPIARAAHGAPRVHRFPRAVLITAPVLGVFMVLLGSGDAVFSHYLQASLGVVPAPSGAPGQLALVVLGTLGLATLLAYAGRNVSFDAAPSDRGRSLLRRGEWVALLAGVDLIFLAFVAVQFATFFGGDGLVQRQPGLTYAAYARSGFVQLLIASLLTAALVAAVWRFGHRDGAADGRSFSSLAGGLVVLTLIVLVSAFRRLSLYESAYGWTWPRLLGHAIVVFVAASLACGLVWIARRRGRWLASAVLVAGLVTLLALNLVDPDRFIAERNVERFHATGRVDEDELASLSADAAPVIVAALPDLPSPQRDLRHALACERDELGLVRGLGSWNIARSGAIEALDAADLGHCGPRPAITWPRPTEP